MHKIPVNFINVPISNYSSSSHSSLELDDTKYVPEENWKDYYLEKFSKIKLNIDESTAQTNRANAEYFCERDRIISEFAFIKLQCQDDVISYMEKAKKLNISWLLAINKFDKQLVKGMKTVLSQHREYFKLLNLFIRDVLPKIDTEDDYLIHELFVKGSFLLLGYRNRSSTDEYQSLINSFNPETYEKLKDHLDINEYLGMQDPSSLESVKESINSYKEKTI
jgi:hypothetical protein